MNWGAVCSSVQELRDVHIYQIDVARPHVTVQLAQGTESVTTRPEPVTVRRKVRLKDRLQDSEHHLLDHPVSYRWNPQGPLTPVRLGDQHPPHRSWAVGPRPKLRDQRVEVLLQVVPKGLHGLPVRPGRAPIGSDRLIGSPHPPEVQHLPHQTVKLPPWL